MDSDHSESQNVEFRARREALQTRVNEAATALLEQGIRPTVARIRTALGGGSPNDLTPAVKHWRETVQPGLAGGSDAKKSMAPPLPLEVAELAYELWRRAIAAAVLEMRGGPSAREVAARTAEAQQLRQQVTDLRDRLQRESLAYGELRAQAARHEAIAREALARVHDGESRERELLRELGELRQRFAQLEATIGRIHSKRIGVAKKRPSRRVRHDHVGRAAHKARPNRRVGRSLGASSERQAQKSERSRIRKRRRGSTE